LGVFLIGVPVSSLAGNDHEAEIAILKGRCGPPRTWLITWIAPGRRAKRRPGACHDARSSRRVERQPLLSLTSNSLDLVEPARLRLHERTLVTRPIHQLRDLAEILKRMLACHRIAPAIGLAAEQADGEAPRPATLSTGRFDGWFARGFPASAGNG
jgi:hypothetical protein